MLGEAWVRVYVICYIHNGDVYFIFWETGCHSSVKSGLELRVLLSAEIIGV